MNQQDLTDLLEGIKAIKRNQSEIKLELQDIKRELDGRRRDHDRIELLIKEKCK
ncbi:hypothetical protein SAMN04487765_1358 [Tenacibaculum sp. MAR_2010_89]|uniref:hypothetical protein n=1 Tax=Tenacibaculum sp. MAR_2010_89 TaxID=1250198 RepID=UPI00089CA129|nr:hypothetical protein [Tenacibaculum sp. MAR_2010_89]SEE09013.1 hypothetical protein SAMN04487765_1358 [Tenacibaculum sp. MAR_2010_89]